MRITTLNHYIGIDLGQRRDYTALAARLHTMVMALNPADTTNAIDASGPGVPVVDILRRNTIGANIMPAFIAAAHDDPAIALALWAARTRNPALLEVG